MTLVAPNQFLTIPAVPTIPASSPPSGPAGGDLTGTYPNPTLVATGPGATGPIGSATVVPIITIDAKGRVTALTSTTISGVAPGGAAGGDLSGTYPNPTVAKINGVALGTTTATSGNLLIASGTTWGTQTMSGDATIGNTGVLALKNTGPGATGPIGDATHVSTVTIDAQGRVTALTSTAITFPSAGNLTGPITSVGLATSIASQTGTGTKFVVDNQPTVQGQTNADPSDNTKTQAWNLSGATTGTKITVASSQTASRTATIPVLGGNDTFAMLGVSNVFSSNNSFSGNIGIRFTGAATSQQGNSGAVSVYRTNGTLQPIGSLILQSDVGQATSGAAIYVGNTPTVGATFFTSAASIGTIASTYTGVVIAGVQTSLAAVAGQVGEVLTGTPTTSVASFAATGTYGNLTGVLALTAGDWLITATMSFFSNTATIGGVAQIGLSSSSAAQTGSSPLNTEGLSLVYIPAGLYTTLALDDTRSISIRYQVSAATNVYFVGKVSYTVGQPQFTASITATRMR